MSRQKGSQYERDVLQKTCEKLGLEYGKDLRRKYSREKGCDIVWLSPLGLQKFPFSFEAKNRKTLSINAWWKKLVDEDTVADLTPLLVFHLHGSNENLVTLRYEDFLNLVGTKTKDE